MFDLVKALTELPGPTGHEDAVKYWIAGRWRLFARDVRRTRVNNVIAFVGGSGPYLLLVAHADEFWLMVTSVSDAGFLHLWPYCGDSLGRPPRWFAPIKQTALVVTSSECVDGVFATASGHVVGGRNSQAGVVSSPARNPWDPRRIPGGSSGGSAVAVALGNCCAAIGPILVAASGSRRPRAASSDSSWLACALPS